jgi:hypothetical protein
MKYMNNGINSQNSYKTDVPQQYKKGICDNDVTNSKMLDCIRLSTDFVGEYL